MFAIRKRQKIFTTLILVAALVFCWKAYAPKARDLLIAWNMDTLATNQQLIDKFEWSVFREDTDVQPGFLPHRRIHKWKIPIRVRLKGEEAIRYRNDVEAILSELSRLSGLSIGVIDNENDPSGNVNFYMASQETLEGILIADSYSQDNIDFLKTGNCSGITTSEDYLIESDVIVILSHYENALKRQCIVEEFTQGLGLYGDSDIIWISTMNDTQRYPFDRLPLNDKIMVRTLYDERLKPGMTREESMPIVRKIIPELVAAIKERGEEALYQ